MHTAIPTPQTPSATAAASGYDTLTRTVTRQLTPMRQALPEVMAAFGDLARTTMAAGALSEKTKELIALALGVAAHCEACIGFHTKALARLGATPEELREALAVAVYMGGGPSLMYSAGAIAAFDEFAGRPRQGWLKSCASRRHRLFTQCYAARPCIATALRYGA